jgi:hypothetical protein
MHIQTPPTSPHQKIMVRKIQDTDPKHSKKGHYQNMMWWRFQCIVKYIAIAMTNDYYVAIISIRW